MGKEVILAVIILIVIYFVFIQPQMKPCHLRTHDLPGKTGLTAAEVCLTMEGTWDDVQKTCVHTIDMFAACENPNGLLRDLCTAAGGVYSPGCNICSGSGIKPGLTEEEAMPAFMNNCANLM